MAKAIEAPPPSLADRCFGIIPGPEGSFRGRYPSRATSTVRRPARSSFFEDFRKWPEFITSDRRVARSRSFARRRGLHPHWQHRQGQAPPRVTVAHPVVRELTDEDDYNGWLEAYATVDVRSRVRGHIQAIHFKDGDFVTKGQLLFELDPRPFQVEINRETANARALDAQKIAAKKDLAALHGVGQNRRGEPARRR